jgi:hypothetical protein
MHSFIYAIVRIHDGWEDTSDCKLPGVKWVNVGVKRS